MKFEQDDLRPIVAAIYTQLKAEQPVLPERLAFKEAEAAALVGVPKHCLRDARLRGEVTGFLLGKNMMYARAELVRFVGGGK